MIDLDKDIELYKSKVAFYESQNTRGEYAVTVRELKFVVETLEALRSEIKTTGDLISREALKKEIVKLCEHINANNGITVPTLAFTRIIDNTPTVEPMESEYGAIQYSNGFNDGFTTAKDTIIHNIAKQYSEHDELVPEWLSIGDLKGGAK